MFCTAPATAAGLLESLPADVRRVYLTGAEPGPGGIVGVREWARAVGDVWAPDGDQYVALAQPRLTYRHRLTGRKVYVLRAAPWFGDTAAPVTCAAAWEALEESLTAAWNFRGQRDARRPVRLFGTPATTGRLLLERQWAETGRTFDPAPDDVQALIRSTSSQGRFELGPAAGVGAPGGLWVYDAAFMYASCSAELPTGELLHDHEHEVIPFARGRYRVDFRAPRTWGHIGLLGVRTDQGMTWPTESAGWSQTWADACEVKLALEYGWQVRPVERLLWPDRSLRPLDTWARRLVKVRENIAEGTAPEARSAEVHRVGHAMRQAVRAILVQTIGALVGAPRKVTRTADVADAHLIPARPLEPATMQAGEWVWTEAAPPAFPSMQHPEWSAHVWAKARARLLSDTHDAGALRVPSADVFALALDSIATTYPVPEWADANAVGMFRLKQHVPGPVPACATMRDYYALSGEPV